MHHAMVGLSAEPERNSLILVAPDVPGEDSGPSHAEKKPPATGQSTSPAVSAARGRGPSRLAA